MKQNLSRGRDLAGKRKDCVEKDNLVTLPFSCDQLDRITGIFNITCNMIRGISDFWHDQFTISVVLEAEHVSSRVVPDRLSAPMRTRLRRALRSLFRICETRGIDWIDWRTVKCSPGGIPRLQITLDEPQTPAWEQLVQQLFTGAAATVTEEEKAPDFHSDAAGRPDHFESHFYDFKDFSARVVIEQVRSSSATRPLTVLIKTDSPEQKKSICKHFFHSLSEEDALVFGYGWEGSPAGMQQAGSNTPAKKSLNPAGENALRFLRSRLSQSNHPRCVMILDRLQSEEDAELIDGLLRSADIPPVTVVVFNDSRGLACDWIIHEKARNYLEIGPLPDATGESAALPEAARRLLYLVQALRCPLPVAQLAAVFGRGESRKMRELMDRGWLYEQDGYLFSTTDKPYLMGENPEKTACEFLEQLANLQDFPLLRIRWCLLKKRCVEAAGIIRKLFGPGGRTEGALPLKKLVLDAVDDHAKSRELLRVAVHLLFYRVDIADLEKLLKEKFYHDPAFGGMKTARIALWRGDYGKVQELVDCLPADMETGLDDERSYVMFVCRERQGDPAAADRHRVRISGDVCRAMADVTYCDRLLYAGEPSRALKVIDHSREVLKKSFETWETLEAMAQRAKCLRELGRISEAESAYRELFQDCRARGITLLAARVANDLGNLYWCGNRWRYAGYWYRRARDLFAGVDSGNGVMLAESNLAEVYKIEGGWEKAETIIRKTLRHDRQKKLVRAMGIDLFNLAHLDYLRCNYFRALARLRQANGLFTDVDHTHGQIECALLFGKLRLAAPGLSREQRNAVLINIQQGQMKAPQRQLFDILNRLYEQPGPELPRPLMKTVSKTLSPLIQFEVMTLIALRFPHAALLETLKVLAASLSDGQRNYFFYQYQWIRFHIQPVQPHSSEQTRRDFFDMYHFFEQNRRIIPTRLRRQRAVLDRHDFQTNPVREVSRPMRVSFANPDEMVYAFSSRLKRELPCSYLHVGVIQGDEIAHQFCTDKDGRCFGERVLRRTGLLAAPLSLPREDMLQLAQKNCENISAFSHAHLVPWRISGNVCVALVLALRSESFRDVDLLESRKELFAAFAPEFKRFFPDDIKSRMALDSLVGGSAIMARLKERIARVSQVDFSVLIEGESGSGKELVARAIHSLSRRGAGPFIAVNAAAIPEHLLEAEMFGYVKGSFTGAAASRTGLIGAASGGTLFMDEIAELPVSLQAKLLRVLQEQTIRRLGENHDIKIDIRLICATHRDLKKMVEERTFRQDLFYRIQDLRLTVPPLRQRLEDIPELIDHILRRHGFDLPEGLTPELLAGELSQRRWAGNVRELESHLKRMITFYPESMDMQAAPRRRSGLRSERARFERGLILRALSRNNWHRTDTAKQLKISRMHLFDLMKKYDLHQP